MSKYNEDLDYLIKDVDISKEEVNKIITSADKIILNPKSKVEKRIEAYLKKVQCLQKLAKYNESKDFVDKLLVFNPNMPEALVRLGIVYDENKEHHKAIEEYNKAIEIKKDYAYAHCMRGMSYDNMLEYNKALQDYTNAIRHKPDCVIAYNNRGWTYIHMCEYDKAIQNFNKSLELKSNYKSSLAGKGYAYLYKNDNDNAIKYYTQAIKIDNANFSYFYFRGQIGRAHV